MCVAHVPFAGSTDVGPRFDKQGTFLSHSVLGPTDDYTAELKNAGIVRSFVPLCFEQLLVYSTTCVC